MEEPLFEFVPEGNADCRPGGFNPDRSFHEIEGAKSFYEFKRSPTEEERLEALKLKNEGNEWFRKKEYQEAILAYTLAIVRVANPVSRRHADGRLHQPSDLLPAHGDVGGSLLRRRHRAQ